MVEKLVFFVVRVVVCRYIRRVVCKLLRGISATTRLNQGSAS